MTRDTDSGARCDDHVGEVFPPRCDACDAEARDHLDDHHHTD